MLLSMLAWHVAACSKGYHIFSERLLLCPGLTVTSLDVKETGEIFIDTISLEQCSTEQRSVIVDVMYLSFYLLWQSPQVCWVMFSTGAWERNFFNHLLILTPTNTHSTHSQPQGDASSYTNRHARTHRLWMSFRNTLVKGIEVSVISGLNPSVYHGP